LAGPSILIKKRLLVMLVLFTLVAVALLGRVAYIQVVKGESLQKKAFEQHNLSIIISPRRGTIYDRNGKELAISASVETIYVNNQDIEKSNKDKEMIAEELAQILELDKEAVLKKLNKKSQYEIIKKKVDREIGDRVRKWIEEDNILGVYIVEDSKRYYPYRNLAAHVIGFTGYDNQGLNGIEIMMEQYLKGVPGRILSEVDAKNRALPFKIEKRIDPQDGLNVILTIDETIQYFAQKALEKAIDDYKVKDGAIAIVMDPRNGDVLAMVSKPDFDLNNPFGPPPGIDPSTWNGHTDEDVNTLSKTVWRNKVISDTYEPGSTFKAITSAAGLEEGIVTPETRTNDSPVVIGKWNFKCWRHYNPHGEESFAEGVYNSCNPVFVRVAQSLGIDRFYSYVKAFGFYDKTGISLPGESKGMFHASPTETDMAAASFGQRFTITPMQLITSYTAIANGGKLMKPRLVRELTDSEGNIIKKFEPEVIRPVISKKTSETLSEILEGVVSIGTGKNAYVKGYRVAGKTGTSETTEEGVYTASFMAFAPADNPVVCVLVALFNPQGDSYMGGVIAAPVAGELIEDILDYLEVERRYTEQDKQMIVQEVYVPEVRGKSIEEAVKRLREFGLEYKIEGDADNKSAVVLEQTPKPDASIPQKSVVILYTYKPEEEITVKMPDVLNKTISEATQALANVGLNIKVEGMGNAWRQEFQPGTVLEKGKVVEVEFRYLDNVE
jgi:stage V sporulation protein D (sporulation-specific penicillin-binding protein)